MDLGQGLRCDALPNMADLQWGLAIDRRRPIERCTIHRATALVIEICVCLLHNRPDHTPPSSSSSATTFIHSINKHKYSRVPLVKVGCSRRLARHPPDSHRQQRYVESFVIDIIRFDTLVAGRQPSGYY